jgi:2,3-bisphosphoglycerate-dependent phosphoglycerate mutase
MFYDPRLLLERGYAVDVTYTSLLKRAIRSAWILNREIHQIYRPVVKTWRLNERMYGALEGFSKPALAMELSEEQVRGWCMV